MSNLRQIKKYPNRRLYDTSESRYITLSDIRRLVIDRLEFEVIEKTTHEDITDRILLQVLAEQELSDEPILGREFLLQTIRLYGSTLRRSVSECLRQSVSSLVSQSSDSRQLSSNSEIVVRG